MSRHHNMPNVCQNSIGRTIDAKMSHIVTKDAQSMQAWHTSLQTQVATERQNKRDIGMLFSIFEQSGLTASWQHIASI